MCGIIGYVGTRDVVPVLINGLKKLEYRGYDSAGIAVVDGHGVDVVRAEGKLANLESKLHDNPLHGTFGMGHTRLRPETYLSVFGTITVSDFVSALSLPLLSTAVTE